EIRDPKFDANYEHYVQEYLKLRKKKGMTLEEAKKTMLLPHFFGAMMIKQGQADGMVSGINSETKPFIPSFQIIGTHEAFEKVSGLFMMVWPEDGRLLFFADCSTIIDPDAKDLAQIAINTAETAKKFGVEPKIAMLSFSTKGSARHAIVDKVIEATKIAQYKRPDLIIDGEMQVDSALVPEVAKKKCPDSPIQGDANVLIFPDLDAGNIAYKLVERLAKAHAVGPIQQGLNMPVNDLSRGCSVQDIVDIAVITVAEAQK
ncbi:MAG TPA: phosphate acetyltransferase, partial [Candidatus Nanoarchaeia archaeon]|nr:phosphate acetyltransferase [Candidatus Nanoarchaeia archaeon]